MVTALLDAWDDVAVEAAVQQGTLKTSTACSYRSMVRTHLKPAFGAVRSDQLTPQVIAKWSRERAHDIEDGELAPKTFNNLLNLLSAVLAWARRPAQRSLAHDPLVGVKRLPRRQIERPFLEPDQIARLLNVAVPPEDTIVMLGAYAGLRRGELCALRWEDIDWGDGEHGRIWIRRAISGGKVSTPKTKGSVRMIDLPGALLTNLKAYRLYVPRRTRHRLSLPLSRRDSTGSRQPRKADLRAARPARKTFRRRTAHLAAYVRLVIDLSRREHQGRQPPARARLDPHHGRHLRHLFKETSIAAMGTLRSMTAAAESSSQPSSTSCSVKRSSCCTKSRSNTGATTASILMPPALASRRTGVSILTLACEVNRRRKSPSHVTRTGTLSASASATIWQSFNLPG